jgi:hypothetical protein
MLFFFELFLFVLVMLTLALGEFVSRWLALILWAVVTVFSLLGYALARQSLGSMTAGSTPAPREREGTEAEEPQYGPLDEKWARTLLYNWRRSNVLLVLGTAAVGGWYWLAG